MNRISSQKIGTSSRNSLAVYLGVSVICFILCAAMFSVSCPAAYAASSGTGDSAGNAAVSTTIGHLTATDTSLDDSKVTVTGEAVGTIYKGDDSGHVWVNIEQDGSTIGVYMTEADAESIPEFGHYGVMGSTIKVTGTYHVACNDGHAGELDIHADSVAVVDAGGGSLSTDTLSWRWILAIIFVAAGLIVLGINTYLHRRKV